MSTAHAPLILVVDDDLAVLGSLTFLLEAEGYLVSAHFDPLRLLAEPMPAADCAVIDYRLPAMSGLELLGLLRQRRMMAPAILITGRSDTDMHAQALAAGFLHVVEKPHLGNRLLEGIRQIVPSHGSSPT